MAGQSPFPGHDARFSPGSVAEEHGSRYPADPPTIEEIVVVMGAAGDGADGARLRAPIVIPL